MPNTVLILGSNLGQKSINLQKAVLLIENKIGKIVSISSIYETEPWGKHSDHSYYNQAMEVETLLEPETLLDVVLGIESDLGRVREERWGDRVIDIDILFYGDSIIDSPRLTIPHPELPNRKFVLLPLTEISPKRVHPILKREIRALLADCPDSSAVEKLLGL